MHALHRPDLHHAAAVAAVCAATAIVLTLLLAGRLNDLTSTSGSPAVTPPVRSTSAAAGWNLNPFMSLLRAPVRAPWTLGF